MRYIGLIWEHQVKVSVYLVSHKHVWKLLGMLNECFIGFYGPKKYFCRFSLTHDNIC